MRATKKRTPTLLDEARGRKRTRIRSSSSHVFTIPESMNLRIFFSKFPLLCFSTRYGEVFYWDQKCRFILYFFIITEKDSLQPSKTMELKIFWKKFVDSGFVKNMWWTRYKIEKLTSSYRVGFGGFSDKPRNPFSEERSNYGKVNKFSN